MKRIYFMAALAAAALTGSLTAMASDDVNNTCALNDTTTCQPLAVQAYDKAKDGTIKAYTKV